MVHFGCAIKNNVERLSIDNKNAKYFAKLLSNCDHIDINVGEVETNIVMFNINKLGIDSQAFLEHCKKEGVLLYPWTSHTIRAITHIDVSRQDVEVAADKIKEVVKSITKYE